MSKITDEEIIAYVEDNIGSFHDKRLESLNELTLDKLLSRKNPYLFKSKNIHTVSDLITLLLDAHLSSQEETLFGDFLEGLAIHVAEKVYAGQKSGITGIDLEFVKNNARYIVSIKSGPNWGNSSQIKKLKDNFNAATQVLKQGNIELNVVAVNGCCYGREPNQSKPGYFKICGQNFWELISNDNDLYTRIIEPLGHDAKQRNDNFAARYGAVVNRFSLAFSLDFCDSNGDIDWDKLVEFASASVPKTSLTPLVARPIQKRNVNRLLTTTSIYNILLYWGENTLAERVKLLTFGGKGNEGEEVDLASIRCFLLLWSGTGSGGDVALDVKEGLLSAEWQFADKRSVAMTFLNIDRVKFTATDIDGQPITIKNGKDYTTRDTLVKKLIERELFTKYEPPTDP